MKRPTIYRLNKQIRSSEMKEKTVEEFRPFGNTAAPAADIPRKLRAIGHGLRPVSPPDPPLTPDITDEEIERMAQMEHAR